MYKVKIEKKVIKKLEKIPSPYYNKIKNCILSLAKNPRPKGCKKLKGRTSDYRVIYEIVDDCLYINILDIGSRGNIY